MEKHSHVLMVEVSNFDYIFIAGKTIDDTNFKLVSQEVISKEYDNENTLRNFELDYNIIKKNIYSIEQRLNCIFKEVILIVDTFDCKIINFSGFKKLNGSQLVKENITYILNLLKSKVNELETKRKILHIFNSNYILDKKSTKNLPIGLFGNFYSHELSFFLIDNNDLKNLENILNKCNLKLKKIISKNFIEGASLINNNSNLETFFKVEINTSNSKIIYFENSSLKFSQEFEFGSEIVIKDISKITNLQSDVIKNILKNSNFLAENLEKDYLEKEYFKNQSYRKIKKKLIFDIANARIKEISEIILIKNINTFSFLNRDTPIFLKIDEDFNKPLKYMYELFFSDKNNFKLNIIEKDIFDDIYINTNRIVQYGWKKEALPIIQEKKSIIGRFFDLVFN